MNSTFKLSNNPRSNDVWFLFQYLQSEQLIILLQLPMIDLPNITLFGQHCVGKTSIINRFCYGTFVKQTSPTMGSSSFRKKMEYQEQFFNLQVWDTLSHQNHSKILYDLMQRTEVAILVYDFSRESTLKEIQKFWIHKLYKKNKNRHLLTILFGNKADKVNVKQKMDEWKDIFQHLKKKYGCLSHYGSCLNKQDQGIELMFQNIVHVIGDKKNRERIIQKEEYMHEEQSDKSEEYSIKSQSFKKKSAWEILDQ